jgi:hypothetical protein
VRKLFISELRGRLAGPNFLPTLLFAVDIITNTTNFIGYVYSAHPELSLAKPKKKVNSEAMSSCFLFSPARLIAFRVTDKSLFFVCCK